MEMFASNIEKKIKPWKKNADLSSFQVKSIFTTKSKKQKILPDLVKSTICIFVIEGPFLSI